MTTQSQNASFHQVCACIASIIRFAHRSAEMARSYIENLDRQRDGQTDAASVIPKQFALEIGAILQLAKWERAELRRYLPADLPLAQDAHRALWQQVTADPIAYQNGQSGSNLSSKVLRTWLQYFAPASLTTLAVDICFPPSKVKDPLEQIADLLWQFRHLGYEEETL